MGVTYNLGKMQRTQGRHELRELSFESRQELRKVEMADRQGLNLGERAEVGQITFEDIGSETLPNVDVYLSNVTQQPTFPSH